MHRDFRRFLFTGEDGRAFRIWAHVVGFFYGLVGFLLVSFLIVGSHQTATPPNSAAVSAHATSVAINKPTH